MLGDDFRVFTNKKEREKSGSGVSACSALSTLKLLIKSADSIKGKCLVESYCGSTSANASDVSSDLLLIGLVHLICCHCSNYNSETAQRNNVIVYYFFCSLIGPVKKNPLETIRANGRRRPRLLGLRYTSKLGLVCN